MRSDLVNTLLDVLIAGLIALGSGAVVVWIAIWIRRVAG